MAIFIGLLLVVTQPVYVSQSLVKSFKGSDFERETGVLSLQGGRVEIPFYGVGFIVNKESVRSWTLSASVALWPDTFVRSVSFEAPSACLESLGLTRGQNIEINEQKQTGKVVYLQIPLAVDPECDLELIIYFSDKNSNQQSTQKFYLHPYKDHYIYSKTLWPYFFG